ncbi:MAG: hypothetical protein HZY79_00690 [Rhodoblastus sp.]|nr:MAG: hypothetical protein HZY79_00690 [Rhodoblastus sp.]
MSAARRLVLTWFAMSALTLAAIPFGHAAQTRPLGRAFLVALLLAVFAKAALLLSHYLDLRHAPSWNAALRAAIFALLALLGVLAAAARLA